MPAVKAKVPRAVGVARRRKGGNLSRKQVFEAHRKAWLVKQQKLNESKRAAKKEVSERVAKQLNRKTHAAFDRLVLNAVQEGLVAVIHANMREEVSPLSLFLTATTAIARSTDASKSELPYLLAIVSSCLPHLSQGFLLHEYASVFALCESMLAENTNSHLVMVKSLKLAQRLLLSLQVPTLDVVAAYEKALKPKNYMNAEAVELFLTTYRKLLENCALCTRFVDPSAALLDGAASTPATAGVETGKDGACVLNTLQRFFLQALPGFTQLCVTILADSPPRPVATNVFAQLQAVFLRCLSPSICGSNEGRRVLDDLLSGPLLSLLKPFNKDYWGDAAETFAALFDRLAYLKRVPGSTGFHTAVDDDASSATVRTLLFTDRLPSTAFLLKVLNKVRAMDDTQLNSKLERAMVAAARCMTMREFTDIIPFDPRAAHEAELREESGDGDAGDDANDDGDATDADDEDDENGDDDENRDAQRGKGRPARRRPPPRQHRPSQALWATSYTLQVIRKAAAHDSLPFFVEHFFPYIQYASKHAKEAERAERREEFHRWSALLLQLWRAALGFCETPLEIDNDSFRDLARQLVGLLHASSGGTMNAAFFIDTAASAIHTLCDGYYALAQCKEDGELDAGGDKDDFSDVASSSTSSASAAESDSSEDADGIEDDEDEDATEALGARRRPSRPAGASVSQSILHHRHHRARHSRRRRVGNVRKDALEDDLLFLAYNDPAWSPHRYYCISQAKAKLVCSTVLAKYSANIMPRLCNVFEHHDSTAVLLAIQSFAKVCAPAVMTDILSNILAVGSTIAAEAEEEREEMGHDGEGDRRKSGATPLSSKRRVVLDIACAVVPQLPAEHVVSLFNDVVEPVLMDPAPDSRLLQKKAYKLLYAMFEHRVKDIFPLFTRIFGLLSVGRQHVTTSGIKMRVRCLSWALDACKMVSPDQLMPAIRATLGEIVVFSREKSSEVRRLTMDVLEKMQRYMTQTVGAPTNALLHLLIAGLSGKTATMVSSSLVCLAKVVFLTHAELPEKDLRSSIAIGFQLMGSALPEVRAAAAMFARMALTLGKRSPQVLAAMDAALPKLLYAIALVTTQPHVSSSARMQMRVLLEKTIKRFGMERIDPIFPLGSKNFLRYTHKMLRREEKKEERSLRQRQKQQQSEFDRFFLSRNGEDGAGGNSLAVRAGGDDEAEGAGDDLLEAGALTSFVARHAARESVMYPGTGRGAAAGATGASSRGDDADDDYDNMHLEFKDGKLTIMSVEERRRALELQRRRELAEQLLRRNKGALLNGDAVNAGAISGAGAGRPGKRSRGVDEAEDFENDELVLRYGSKLSDDAVQKAATGHARGGRAGGAGSGAVGPSATQIARLRDQKAARQEMKRQRVEEDIRKGDEFRGTGAGDVKRGNVEPYAYVPLNRRYMNRRHSRQALHRFEVINNTQLRGEKAKAAKDTKR